MENGSGGFMSDLKFTGGRYGMWVGNQQVMMIENRIGFSMYSTLFIRLQFLSLDLEFDNCDTAIYMNWVRTIRISDK